MPCWVIRMFVAPIRRIRYRERRVAAASRSSAVKPSAPVDRGVQPVPQRQRTRLPAWRRWFKSIQVSDAVDPPPVLTHGAGCDSPDGRANRHMAIDESVAQRRSTPKGSRGRAPDTIGRCGFDPHRSHERQSAGPGPGDAGLSPKLHQGRRMRWVVRSQPAAACVGRIQHSVELASSPRPMRTWRCAAVGRQDRH